MPHARQMHEESTGRDLICEARPFLVPIWVSFV
jgi:hypothetical protein